MVKWFGVLVKLQFTDHLKYSRDYLPSAIEHFGPGTEEISILMLMRRQGIEREGAITRA